MVAGWPCLLPAAAAAVAAAGVWCSVLLLLLCSLSAVNRCTSRGLRASSALRGMIYTFRVRASRQEKKREKLQ